MISYIYIYIYVSPITCQLPYPVFNVMLTTSALSFFYYVNQKSQTAKADAEVRELKYAIKLKNYF